MNKPTVWLSKRAQARRRKEGPAKPTNVMPKANKTEWIMPLTVGYCSTGTPNILTSSFVATGMPHDIQE